jgi:hypothetical protein
MKSTVRGMNFLDAKANDLPPYTFVSFEAVGWLLEHVEGVVIEREAIELVQKMINERLVCHTSGDTRYFISFMKSLFLYIKKK